MAQRYVMPIQSTFDDSGLASAGDKLNFYSTGTLTRKDTFSDSALTSANANPVVADSAGRFPDIFLESGDYKVVLTDSADVETWTADPVAGAVGSSGVVDEKTGAYTVTIDDATKIIACDASGGAFPIALPAAATAGNGFEITVKKTDTSTNAVTVDADGAETIDGETTYVLSGRKRAVTLRSDGTNWQILSIGTPAKPDVQAKTTTYTVLVSDDGSLIDADASGGAFTITLPTVAAAGDGFEISIKKTDSGANAVTVDGNGAETIDGATTRTLGQQYEGEIYRCDGTEWHVVARLRPSIETADLPDGLAKLEFVSTAAITAQPTLTVEDLAAGYDYIIALEGFAPTADAERLWCRYSDDGSTIESGPSDYQWAAQARTLSTASEGDSEIELGGSVETWGNDAGNYSRIEFIISNPANTDESACASWQGHLKSADATPQIHDLIGSSLFFQGTNAVVDVQFLWSGGSTFKAQGDISVWRRKRS